MSATSVIYLDHHATTPCDPRVVEAMLPWFTERFGNPASRQHGPGRDARAAVEAARRKVASLIGASPREVVFTSGATEAINLALKGIFARAAADRRRVVTTTIEHSAVRDVCAWLQTRGVEVVEVPVDAEGLVDPAAVADACAAGPTGAVAVMAANNEIGTVQPLRAIAPICRAAGAALFSDAAQLAGKLTLDVRGAGIDLAALSAHKLYGPKGVGALYVRRGAPHLRLEAQIHGGGHERGLRSGTLNVPGIVGFGVACELAAQELDVEASRLRSLSAELLERLRAGVPGLVVNGSMSRRLPHNLHVAIPGLEARRLLEAVDGVALSSGSACTTDQLEPSHVLRAIGLREDLVYASIRVGLGRTTCAADVEEAASRIVDAVRRLRGVASPGH